jgi:hypothetical protein
MSESEQANGDDIKSKPWNFLFTRHALSCNNTDQGKYFGKDYEPSITTLGIEQLVNYDNNPKDNIYKFDDKNSKKMGTEFVESGSAIGHNFEQPRIGEKKVDAPQEFSIETFRQNNTDGKLHVVVSPLIRTWETATVLYLKANPNSTELNLYIGPYLKEKLEKNMKRGNFYLAPEKIIPKFRKFLDILYKLHKDLFNSMETIILHWPKFYKFNISDPQFLKFQFTKEVIENTAKFNITIISPDPKIQCPNMSKLGQYYASYILMGALSGDNGCFSKEGDLKKFMDVFQTSDKGYPNALIQNPDKNPDLSFQPDVPDVPDGVPANSDLETRLYGDSANRKTIEPEPRGLVHVVTHSQVMQKFFNQVIFRGTYNEFKYAFPLLEESNCWSFVGSIYNYGHVLHPPTSEPPSDYYRGIEHLMSRRLVWAGVPGNKVEIEVDGKKISGVKRQSQKQGSITCGLSGSTGTKLTCQGEVQTNDLDDADADDGNQVVSTGDGSQVGSRDGSQNQQVVTPGKETNTIANRVSNFFSSFGSKSQPQGGKRSKRRMGKKGKTRKNKKGKKTRKLRKRK